MMVALPREIGDGGSAGLHLRISSIGEKVWVLRYVVGGKRERHTLGAYHAVTIADARKWALEYRSLGNVIQREAEHPAASSRWTAGQRF